MPSLSVPPLSLAECTNLPRHVRDNRNTPKAIARPGKHVDLGGEFDNELWSWTNDIKHMKMDIWFDPNGPNLAGGSGLDGLCPILRDKHGSAYLLTDKSGRFYICDPEQDARIYVYRDANLSRDDAIYDVLTGVNWNKLAEYYKGRW